MLTTTYSVVHRSSVVESGLWINSLIFIAAHSTAVIIIIIRILCESWMTCILYGELSMLLHSDVSSPWCGVPSANDLLWQNANNKRIAIRRNTIVVYVVEHDSSCSKLPRENLSKRYNRLSCIHMPSRNFKRNKRKKWIDQMPSSQ